MSTAKLRTHIRSLRRSLTPQQQAEHAHQALTHLISYLEHQSTPPQKIALFLSQDGELDTQPVIDYLWQNTDHALYLPVLERPNTTNTAGAPNAVGQPSTKMCFMCYTPESVMVKNHFNILEPVTPTVMEAAREQVVKPTLKSTLASVKGETMKPDSEKNSALNNKACVFQGPVEGCDLDMVLMPLVAFDLQGNRMGMGGGYYDRAFAFKLQADSQTKSQTKSQSTQPPNSLPQSPAPKTVPQLIGWAHSCQAVNQLNSEVWDVPLDSLITEKGLIEFK